MKALNKEYFEPVFLIKSVSNKKETIDKMSKVIDFILIIAVYNIIMYLHLPFLMYPS